MGAITRGMSPILSVVAVDPIVPVVLPVVVLVPAVMRPFPVHPARPSLLPFVLLCLLLPRLLLSPSGCDL